MTVARSQGNGHRDRELFSRNVRKGGSCRRGRVLDPATSRVVEGECFFNYRAGLVSVTWGFSETRVASLGQFLVVLRAVLSYSLLGETVDCSGPGNLVDEIHTCSGRTLRIFQISVHHRGPLTESSSFKNPLSLPAYCPLLKCPGLGGQLQRPARPLVPPDTFQVLVTC